MFFRSSIIFVLVRYLVGHVGELFRFVIVCAYVFVSVSRSIASVRFMIVTLVFRVWRVRSSLLFVLLVIASSFVLRSAPEIVRSGALREGGLYRSGLVKRNRFSTLIVLRLSAVRAPHSSVNVPGTYHSFASRSTFFGLTCTCVYTSSRSVGCLRLVLIERTTVCIRSGTVGQVS